MHGNYTFKNGLGTSSGTISWSLSYQLATVKSDLSCRLTNHAERLQTSRQGCLDLNTSSREQVELHTDRKLSDISVCLWTCLCDSFPNIIYLHHKHYPSHLPLLAEEKHIYRQADNTQLLMFICHRSPLAGRLLVRIRKQLVLYKKKSK